MQLHIDDSKIVQQFIFQTETRILAIVLVGYLHIAAYNCIVYPLPFFRQINAIVLLNNGQWKSTHITLLALWNLIAPVSFAKIPSN